MGDHPSANMYTPVHNGSTLRDEWGEVDEFIENELLKQENENGSKQSN